MEKPVSLQVVELRKNLISTINEAKLPAWAVRPIVSDLLATITREEELQYKADLAQWAEAQKGED